MKVTYTLNNYTIGAKLKTAPTHKIIIRQRVDSKTTLITFDLTEKEKAFTDKLFGKKGNVESY